VPTYSAHWIADPALERAIADFLRRETRAIERERCHLAGLSPYRGDEGHTD
jgi:predicted N-acyltransferase